MTEPYSPAPAPTGSAAADRASPATWLEAADGIAPEEYDCTCAAKNGNTVALLHLGAKGPSTLLAGAGFPGYCVTTASLDLARKRISRRLVFRQQHGSGVLLEDEFKVPAGGSAR